MTYKDREGNVIKLGDVVATAINMNQERYLLSYSVAICKKQGRNLILDGPIGSCFLSDMKSEQMQKLTKDTDLRSLWADWIRKFRQNTIFNEDVRESNASWQKIIQHVKNNQNDIAFEIFKKSLEDSDSTHEIKEFSESINSRLEEIKDLTKDLTEEYLDSVKYLVKKSKKKR